MSGERATRLARRDSADAALGRGAAADVAAPGGCLACATREAELGARIEIAEAERHSVLARLRGVEAEARRLAARAELLETENNDLANLYVAARQLHSSLDPDEILATIAEVVINLIGAERFAIHLVDEVSGRLVVALTEGGTAAHDATRPASELAASALASGEICCVQDVLAGGGGEPIACIPLRVAGWPVGVIEIERLLPQKRRFTPLDFELFDLLAVHAAVALLAAHPQADRTDEAGWPRAGAGPVTGGPATTTPRGGST